MPTFPMTSKLQPDILPFEHVAEVHPAIRYIETIEVPTCFVILVVLRIVGIIA